MAQEIGATTFWSETTASPKPPMRLRFLVGVAALGAAVATGFALPASSYRAKAVVSISEPTSTLSTLLVRTAAETAVSRPVMSRAAESLIGTGFPVPEADLAERAAVAARLGIVTPTGKAARLAAALSRLVVARPGEMPGSLEIVASTGEADQAPQAAAAVAAALVADQDDTLARARRQRDIDASARLERVKADAAAARRQLTALDGAEADPAQALATATAQTARAQARLDVIRVIMASGTPPLSDRRDVPAPIAALQSSYLDLSRQLATARETLGERHTTIITLNAELRHAAAGLTAEWRRLSKMAETDLEADRDREGQLRKAGTGGDAKRRDSVEIARRNLQVADGAVARMLSGMREPMADEGGYRLVGRPVVPNAASGLSLAWRIFLGALAGLVVAGLGLFGLRRREIRQGTVRAEPSVFATTSMETADIMEAAAPLAGMHEAASVNDDATDIPETVEPVTAQASSRPEPETEPSLLKAMADLLPDIEAIAPAFGPLPTVMVASNEITADVTHVTLALGRAAADSGLRVLAVEATRAGRQLAAAADAEADPILVDFFGTLRVVFRAQASQGALFLALSLQDGTRIASALARDGETPLVDDIGAEFDLVLIDGGRAGDAAAAGWGADAYLRVGRYRAKRDDQLFASSFGVAQDAVLGAVVASTFSKTPVTPPLSAIPTTAPGPANASPPRALSPSIAMRHAPRRKIVAR